MDGWMITRWWWSSPHTWRSSGSAPHAVAVLSTVSPAGTVKSLASVAVAPTARDGIVALEICLSSLTVTLVSGTSPVLVTAKVYVTTSPSGAEDAADFTTLMDGWMITRWWWS